MLLLDYFNSFNLYKNYPGTKSRRGVRVKKENEKFTVVCSCSPKNLLFVHFTLFCWERLRNLPKCKTHLQSDCFLIKPNFLRRCRRPRRRHCLSSLVDVRCTTYHVNQCTMKELRWQIKQRSLHHVLECCLWSRSLPQRTLWSKLFKRVPVHRSFNRELWSRDWAMHMFGGVDWWQVW